MIRGLLMLALLGAAGCLFGRHRAVREGPPPPPCAGDTAVYTVTDSTVSPPRPKLPITPPQDFAASRVTVEGIVEPDGAVRQARVVVSGGATADSQLLAALRQTQFLPAVRHGCAVRFALPVTISVF
jgi:TonB family protein